jgi:lipopolysaccharide/colanic/teichoic acid biosynthesis glycosyltransferase
MPRLLELIVALIGGAIFAPFILLLALAVRLTSKGPALFLQTRLGKEQKPFKIVKIRTMVAGTREAGTHLVNGDAITPLGRLLRKFRLDELPQFINVIKGDMSFVGPRPCLPSQQELILAREQAHVFDIRPGITGLAQVKGIDMSNPRHLASIDGEYVKSRTLLLDLKIIMKTLCGGGIDNRATQSKSETKN